MAAAVKVGRYFDIDDSKIASAILSFQPDNNRSQAVDTKHNRVVVDCYNANPSSMAVALDNIASMEGERKVFILGDMRELGRWSREEHCAILRKVDKMGAEVWLVGKEFAAAHQALDGKLEGKYRLFDNVGEVVSYLDAEPLSDALILLKGSRGVALEKALVKL